MQNITHNGSDWWWELLSGSEEICLHLSDTIRFPTGYSQGQSIVDFNSHTPFCAKDAKVYVQVCDVLTALKFSEEMRFSLAISATFATQYLTPLATRSWYFKLADISEFEMSDRLQQSKIAAMSWVVLETNQPANYLVLQTSGETAYVMLVDKEHHINSIKKSKQGDVFNVHKDRLTPLVGKLQVMNL